MDKNKFNTLEEWVFNEVFTPIEEAAEKDKDFTLHLDAEKVKNLAYEIRSLEWIEMY